MNQQQAIQRRTDASRATPLDRTQPTRPEVPRIQGIVHAVIVEIPDEWADDNLTMKVAIILPDPADEARYTFATYADGSLRKITAWCQPGTRAKHYAQWLWRGTLDVAAPLWIEAMRSRRIYGAYGRLYVDHSPLLKYSRAVDGAVPTDCYITDER